MDIKDDAFGCPGSNDRLAKARLTYYLISFLLLASMMLCNTAYAKQVAVNATAPSPLSLSIPSYIFDSPSLLSHAINIELAPLLDETKIRIINGGILTQSDFDEWSSQMGKDKTVKYQQAFYSAFAGDNGPKSLTNIRVTDNSGQNMMNCVISHPNTDWHLAWAIGGINMSMQYGKKDYNLNDVSEFVLFHEGKHCLSKNVSLLTNERLSDAFAALVYRWKHDGKTAMLKDIIGFRHYQLESSNSVENTSFKQAAHDHDTRNVLQKIIDLDFESDIQGLSIDQLNSLANKIVEQSI